MAAGPLNRVIRHLRQLAGTPRAGKQSDGMLLERFAAYKEEAAFEELMQRHGPMVVGVCRRVLGNAADADDAFQATFLVLARKAASLRKCEAVGSWLCGVAYRTALKARTCAARRRYHEGQAVKPAAQDAPTDLVWRDLRPVLDEELNRLPEKYRVPIVLCYLEGKTQQEAAQLLGWPTGTVATRLNRARERLRERLTRRGLTLTGGVLAGVLSENVTLAAVPASLAASTCKAAILFAAGNAAGSAALAASAVALAEGVLRTMLLTKLRIAVAVVLTTGLLGFGAGALREQGQAAEEQGVAKETAKVSVPPATTSKLKDLLKARAEAAEKEYVARHASYMAGREALFSLTEVAQRVLKARLEAAETRAQRVAILETHWRRMKELEDVTQVQFDAGRKAFTDLVHAQYFRLDAEVELERAKAK